MSKKKKCIGGGLSDKTELVYMSAVRPEAVGFSAHKDKGKTF